MPIALSDTQLRELMQAAQLVPLDLRNVFLERVAVRLRGQDLGDGLVHRVSYEEARSICWGSERTAAVG